MAAQGHGGICQNVLEQDNGSAMKLEINGRTSAGPSRSRHIDFRYFWITDWIRSKGKRIWHFPASEMLGDFFTRQLQCSLFRKVRDVLLGYRHEDCWTYACEYPC